jgi:hypothetical protein
LPSFAHAVPSGASPNWHRPPTHAVASRHALGAVQSATVQHSSAQLPSAQHISPAWQLAVALQVPFSQVEIEHESASMHCESLQHCSHCPLQQWPPPTQSASSAHAHTETCEHAPASHESSVQVIPSSQPRSSQHPRHAPLQHTLPPPHGSPSSIGSLRH